jgi:predicted metal-dependent hydrolase
MTMQSIDPREPPPRPSPKASTSPLRAREIRFDPSKVPLHWVPGDVQTTHTINVLHMLFPSGERWFGKVFAKALQHIDDPELRARARGFAAQEGAHGNAHDRVLDDLRARGLDTARFVATVDWLFDELLADQPFGKVVPPELERTWLLHRLTIIAMIEHYTSFLGHWILHESGPLEDAGADPQMLDLLRWHGAEEVEHREVAYDVACALGATWLHRLIATIETTPVFVYVWLRATVFLTANDPVEPTKPTFAAFKRAGERGVLPKGWPLLRELARFLRPGYHPGEIGSTAAALDYLASSRTVVSGAK